MNIIQKLNISRCFAHNLVDIYICDLLLSIDDKGLLLAVVFDGNS